MWQILAFIILKQLKLINFLKFTFSQLLQLKIGKQVLCVYLDLISQVGDGGVNL